VLTIGIVLLSVAFFLLEGWEKQPQADDAYISYRYARNLVEGNGLVYNVGERVEGYTNLLWTLLVALGIALGGRAPDVAHLLGLASGTATLLATYAYASAGVDPSKRWIAALAPLLLLAWIGFPGWALSGLETPLFAATVAVSLAAEARKRIGVATIAAMGATLTRPEGPLLAAVVLGLAVLGGRPQERRRALAWGLVYAAFLAILTAFRIFYYGSPVPNTYFAKVGETGWLVGLGDLGKFLSSSALPLLIPAVWAAWRDRTCRAGALWAVSVAAYIVWIGGDAFPHHRFWVPVMVVVAPFAARALILQRETNPSLRGEAPFWILVSAAVLWSLVSPRFAFFVGLGLAVAALAGVWGARARWVAASVVFVVLLAFGAIAAALLRLEDATFSQLIKLEAAMLGSPPLGPVEASWSRPMQAAWVLLRSRAGRSRGEIMQALLVGRFDHQVRAHAAAKRILGRRKQGEHVELVAATAIGRFGYDIPLPILDMLGLVDAHIARSPRYVPTKQVFWVPGHTRTDADYVFSRRPDYIFVQRKGSVKLLLPLHDDIWSHPALERDYEWDEAMRAYRRKR
jgi:hypothetical protein